MEKKVITSCGSVIAVAAVLVGLIIVGANSNIGVNPVLGAETDYTITFDRGTNKIGAGAGTGAMATGLGNSVGFSYSGFASSTDYWQTLQAGGYFTNTDPIHGMKSIQLTKADAAASLQVFWSATTTFDDAKSATYDASSALSFTCDFSSYYPNYVKVLALGSAGSSITSGVITFSCSDHYALGSSYTLGKYPQTVVEDSATLTALASATDTDSDGYLEYGSDEYKKATGAPYWDNYKSTSGSTTFATGTTYYFKVEPIVWRVLFGKGTATGLVMAEKVLTNGCYYPDWNTNRTISGSTVYANNYQYSTLRAMLNGYDGSAYSVANFTGKGFLDVAFTEAEKAYITTTTVDNSAATTDSSSNSYACADTSDRIFALSYQDLLNTSYGFSSSTGSISARYGVLTDYARATGAYMSTGNGLWWSRSPIASHSDSASCVSYDGALNYTGVSSATKGVRPSFIVNIG